ncbi:hypothetical protein EDB80DRAFT_881174 [Ilyonectria destructans]|nr:hypothetical protein EDB80DRAFT_881174 [Ilyonectria destructans]
MVLSMHHALYDGVSSEILLDTVAKLYQNQTGDGYEGVLQLEWGMEPGLLPTASQRDKAASTKAAAEDLPFEKGDPSFILHICVWVTHSPYLALVRIRVHPGLILGAQGRHIWPDRITRILHPDLVRVMSSAMATLPSITYVQLDKLTNAIVSRLASHEIHLQADDIAATCMSRDIKSLAATLAIFWAGYMYLPVDEDLRHKY